MSDDKRIGLAANQRAFVTCAPTGDHAEAEDLARRCGLTLLERRERPLRELPTPLLVLASDKAELYLNGKRFRASPGLALLRLKRDEQDPLARDAGLRPGEEVLDATLGLGGDALVAAQATGTTVVGLEASPLLAAFTAAGLKRLPHAEAARIDVRCADHRAELQRLPDRSFDVVLFDPMFPAPGATAPIFDVVRACAEHAPLTHATLAEARRVARRGVLVKSAAPGHELAALGLRALHVRRPPRILFGWIDRD